MDSLNRRDFLKTSSQAAGSAAALSLLVQSSPAKAASRQDVVRVAVVGARGRGMAHLTGFEDLPDAEVVAICDVDENVLGDRATSLEKKTGRSIKRAADMQRLFEDPDIDAVSFATPNHWHALGGIRAMQAGKHVYVEKPCCHNVWEGRQLVNASRRYDRLCQHGTQGRSSPAVRDAVQLLQDGVIGDVYLARGLCYKWRPSIGKVDGPQPIPKGVDYNMWLGPAQQQPLMRKNLHYDWHWQWDFGNGDMGNQGVHEMDMARWGLGVRAPSRIQAMGGHVMFDDDQQTPNMLLVTFEYPETGKMLQFETRHWISNYEGEFGSNGSNNVGVLFYGSEGYMSLGYFGYKTFLGKKREPGPSGSSDTDNFAPFVAAVKSGDHSLLTADIEEGFLSSIHCHLGNIAYRTGRTIHFDESSDTISGDPEASQLLTRDYRSGFEVPAIS